MSRDFQIAFQQTWESYLAGILGATREEEGTALAVALLDELATLGSSDPLTSP